MRANRGAAGIDKQTIADVEEYGIGRLLDELAADLKDGSYRPLAARRVFIPKPGSLTEQRPLSIPHAARHPAPLAYPTTLGGRVDGLWPGRFLRVGWQVDRGG